jgi:hypothetical protein
MHLRISDESYLRQSGSLSSYSHRPMTLRPRLTAGLPVRSKSDFININHYVANFKYFCELSQNFKICKVQCKKCLLLYHNEALDNEFIFWWSVTSFLKTKNCQTKKIWQSGGLGVPFTRRPITLRPHLTMGLPFRGFAVYTSKVTVYSTKVVLLMIQLLCL